MRFGLLSTVDYNIAPYVQISVETVRRHNADVALVYDFVNEGSLHVDIFALRKLHPGLKDFDTWLRETGKATLLEIDKALA